MTVQSEAYKLAYSTANQSPESISSNAYKLAHQNTAVVLRIQELTRDIRLSVVEAKAWDRIRLINKAETYLHLAREAKQIAQPTRRSRFSPGSQAIWTDQWSMADGLGWGWAPRHGLADVPDSYMRTW